MRKKLILFFIVLLVIGGIVFLLIIRGGQQDSLSNPPPALQKVTNQFLPSNTFKEYTDPTGFSFNYPDSLSLTKNETDDETYADLQLSASGINGSLALKISDSKYKSLDEWVKASKGTSEGEPKEVKLGSLKAFEIKLADRLLMGAVDQGVLFAIEMPLLEEEFWMKVYSKILADFSFSAPAQESTVTQTGSSPDGDVVFEGEEVVE